MQDLLPDFKTYDKGTVIEKARYYWHNHVWVWVCVYTYILYTHYTHTHTDTHIMSHWNRIEIPHMNSHIYRKLIFNKVGNNIQWENDFWTNGAGIA